LSLSGSIYSSSFVNPGSGADDTVYYLAPNATTDPSSSNNVAISSSTEANFVVVPAACTVSALNVGANNYYSAGADTVTIAVFKNSVATSMTCGVTVNNNGNSCSDTTHTFAADGGDTLAISFSETNINPYVKVTTTLICK
jgi:hypothetical protein